MYKVVMMVLLLLWSGLDATDPTDEEYREMERCFSENGLYIRGCDVDSIYHSMLVLNRRGKTDEDNIRCTMYDMISSCYVTRIEEKCGLKNALLARKRLKNRPTLISKACQAAATPQAHLKETQRETKEIISTNFTRNNP